MLSTVSSGSTKASNEKPRSMHIGKTYGLNFRKKKKTITEDFASHDHSPVITAI